MDVVFCMEKVLLYWSVGHYSNVLKCDRLSEKSDRLPGWGRKGLYYVNIHERSLKLSCLLSFVPRSRSLILA